jgi:peroxiredoxin
MHDYAKQLAALGANGLPLNKDGSVARRKTTEEQRVDAGMMSDEERKAHKALVEDVTGDEKKAERSGTDRPKLRTPGQPSP